MMNKDVKVDINQFAGIIASMQGMEVPHGYDFEESPNPNAVGCWKVAKASYDFWHLKFVRTPAKTK